jgi:hypothetical protein
LGYRTSSDGFFRSHNLAVRENLELFNDTYNKRFLDQHCPLAGALIGAP